ncbi:carboxylesterase/lipase family protein [Piscinibacter sakaiensis]|uniref:carboxylesterase/lipase family protein n=1 Tax=Piscinibacter sakaiensis TaxID=1547922 RepID=UPI003AAB0B15
MVKAIRGIDSATPIATVAQGELQGTRNGAVLSFKGVPYAANPFTAANRFKAPQPMPAWSGVRNAVDYRPMPPQPSRAPSGGLAGAADDLTLNIWAPADARNAPVLVWLPGGAYYRVDAAEGWYDGSSFARQGIVVVTVNYRVGIDGFMAIDGMPANRGLLDSVAALEWTKTNIAAFGGDAGNVTLAGQSAGAQSVMLLMGMPMAQGLFHKAIAQSPPQNHLTPSQAQRIASATAETLKVAPTAQALAAVPLPDLIAGVEAMVKDLRDRAKWGPIGGQPPYLPVIDGKVLTAPPLAALQRNASPRIPLLIGSTDEEARLYLVPGGTIDRIPPPAVAGALRGARLPAHAADVYSQARANASPGDMLALFESDQTFRMPTLNYAEQRVRAGAPVWHYNFSWSSPGFGGRLGAGHVVDVPFAFNTLGSRQAAPFLGGPGHQPLADEMHGRWARFVKTGDAGWPRYDLTTRPTMRFDTTSTVVADPLADRRKLWAGIGFE